VAGSTGGASAADRSCREEWLLLHKRGKYAVDG
jgi:hypothetical protein